MLQFLFLCALAVSTNGQKKSEKLSSLLQALLNQQQPVATASDATGNGDQSSALQEALGARNGMISIDVTTNAEENIEDLINDLAANGCRIQGSYKHMVSAKCDVSALEVIGNLASVHFVHVALAKNNAVSGNKERLLATAKRALAGKVTSQGVNAMNADKVQTALGLTGAGIKIGVLANSFNNLGGAAADIASGDLPSDGVVVLKDYLEDGADDEGRALLQIIHDVAPGAKLYFHTAHGGQADFAAGIVKLAEAGCNIIVDDVAYFAEPMFQDGISAQAVDQVFAMGVAYFSAAGNNARQSWAGPFVDSGDLDEDGAKFHNFNPSHTLAPFDPRVKTAIPISLTEGVHVIILNWDQPSHSASPGIGCQSEYDLYLIDPEGSATIYGGGDDNFGKDAIELIQVNVPPGHNGQFSLQIVKIYGADAGLMQIIISGNGDFSNNLKTNTGTSWGHCTAKGAAGVGAIFSMATPAYGVNKMQTERFSSMGGIPKLFDVNGNRLPTPEIRKQPRFSAPDGVYTTFFGYSYPNYTDPLFFGTSAAAPHASAFAALLLQANPKLTPDEIYIALEQTAIDLNDPYGWTAKGYDFQSGYGLVDAFAAVNYVKGQKKAKKGKKTRAIKAI